MHKLLFILTACFIFISLSACQDNGHSHDDASHSHENAPQHHDSIN